MSHAVVVVPCYNEAKRLDPEPFRAMLRARPGLSVLFVDDGSTDETFDVLNRMRADDSARVRVRRLDQNVGKAEAVRAGLRQAIDEGADFAGYYDADASTPADQMVMLIERIEGGAHDAVIGARVGLLGWGLERSLIRHYFGRLFATAASITLGMGIYDTQCGAKIFRVTPGLRKALIPPFHSRWAFDVELLGRLSSTGAEIVEMPVRGWRHVRGSKISAGQMVGATLALARIAFHLRRQPPDPLR